jgi:von Willebrand factor type A domain
MLITKVRWTVSALVLAAGLVCPVLAQEAANVRELAPSAADAPSIQLAILLDTSGSMNGLINQARTQIWSIVNDMTKARMEGKRPRLTVALYEYGKSSIPASDGYLRQILPLTDDLDEVSKQLFALTTNGGEEYCGKVIGAATQGLSWSDSARDLKIIVIAGNEPFTQGDTDYKQTVQAAVKRGIIIDTIFCGPEEEGIRTSWQDGARRGEGTYSFIDQTAASIHIEAPQDKELAELSSKLNDTYLGYGVRGEELKARQAAQDVNAAAGGRAVVAERAASKASGAYQNAAWDLVDAVKEKRVKLEDLKDDQLPEAMRGKTAVERQQIVDQAGAERGQIQQQIQKLQTERAAFVATEIAKHGEDKSLGTALGKALRVQAAGKGYSFETR